MKYESSIEIINMETGELTDISMLSQNINEIDINELGERVVILKQILANITEVYRVVEYNFIKEMNEKEAKKHIGNNFTIQLNSQVDYDYDTEYVHKIKELIPQEQFDNIFTEKYKVNRNYLKGIIVLGGEVKELAESMQKKTVRKPTLTITSNKK